MKLYLIHLLTTVHFVDSFTTSSFTPKYTFRKPVFITSRLYNDNTDQQEVITFDDEKEVAIEGVRIDDELSSSSAETFVASDSDSISSTEQDDTNLSASMNTEEETTYISSSAQDDIPIETTTREDEDVVENTLLSEGSVPESSEESIDASSDVLDDDLDSTLVAEEEKSDDAIVTYDETTENLVATMTTTQDQSDEVIEVGEKFETLNDEGSFESVAVADNDVNDVTDDDENLVAQNTEDVSERLESEDTDDGIAISMEDTVDDTNLVAETSGIVEKEEEEEKLEFSQEDVSTEESVVASSDIVEDETLIAQNNVAEEEFTNNDEKVMLESESSTDDNTVEVATIDDNNTPIESVINNNVLASEDGSVVSSNAEDLDTVMQVVENSNPGVTELLEATETGTGTVVDATLAAAAAAGDLQEVTNEVATLIANTFIL